MRPVRSSAIKKKKKIIELELFFKVQVARDFPVNHVFGQQIRSHADVSSPKYFQSVLVLKSSRLFLKTNLLLSDNDISRHRALCASVRLIISWIRF